MQIQFGCISHAVKIGKLNKNRFVVWLAIATETSILYPAVRQYTFRQQSSEKSLRHRRYPNQSESTAVNILTIELIPGLSI